MEFQYKLGTVGGINDDGLDTDNFIHTPGIALQYNFSEDAAAGIAYRHYNNNDSIYIDNEYGVNRLTTWMELNF